jgi:phage baseplate assembly protein W
MRESKDEIFSDFDLAFISHPVTKKLSRKTNRESVKQSVKSLILTNFYERPYRPDIGCNINGYLFELFTPDIKQVIEESIRTVIRNNEPRADIIAVLVEDRTDTNTLLISVAFRVQNEPDPVYLDVLLERVR